MYNENDQEVIQNIIQISVLLFVCVRLHLHRDPRSEAEGVFEDGCFGKAYVLIPASRHRRIVVVCRLRLLGSANSLLWAVSLVQNDTQSFRTSLRGTFRIFPSAHP